jgi:shikimate kinase
VPDRSRLVLVGFMGSGKTTVGRLVAKKLGWGFVDMDRRLEQRLGMPIAAYFRTHGEAAFRQEELRCAEELAPLDHHVVAAGGGAFAQPETRRILGHNSITVWLRCDLETIVRRVPADGSRPLAGNREIMKTLLTARESSYREADLVVESSDADPGVVAERVVQAMRDRTGAPPKQ